MADRDHIIAIRDAVSQLNKAIASAAQDGLSVDINTITQYRVGDPRQYPSFDFHITTRDAVDAHSV